MTDTLASSDNLSSSLTIERAAKLFIASFEHSQGNQTAQWILFEQISQTHPEYALSEKDRSELIRRVTKPIDNILQPNKHTNVDSEKMKKVLEKEIDNMIDCLSKKPKLPNIESFSISDLLEELIVQEYGFLCVKGGRPREKDKYFSYICHYALEGNKTGIKEFDEIYEEIGKFIQSGEKLSILLLDTTLLNESQFSLSPEQLYHEFFKGIKDVYQAHYPANTPQSLPD